MKTRKFDIVNIKDINELRYSLYCMYIFHVFCLVRKCVMVYLHQNIFSRGTHVFSERQFVFESNKSCLI